MTHARLAVLPLLATALLAQAQPCASLNDATNSATAAITAFAFTGPTSLGWQFTPTTPVVAQALRIFTGNTMSANSMKLEIWSNDTATNLPLARLAGGSWRINTNVARDWQGTNLDAIQVLQPNVAYWLVWIEPGFSQVPTEQAGTNLPAARMPFNGAWAGTAASALKFRIYCSLLAAPNVVVRGTACASPAGTGTAFTNDAPTVGNAAFHVEGTGYPPGAGAALILGFQGNAPSLPLPGGAPGCFLHQDVFLVFAGTIGTGNVRTPTPTGHVAFPLPIPADPTLTGLFVGAQVGALDATSTYPLPFVTSNGLRLTVF